MLAYNETSYSGDLIRRRCRSRGRRKRRIRRSERKKRKRRKAKSECFFSLVASFPSEARMGGDEG